MGCGVSASARPRLAPRMNTSTVGPVVRAFERCGVPVEVAVAALEEQGVLPGNNVDLCVALGVSTAVAARGTRAEVLAIGIDALNPEVSESDSCSGRS